MFANYLEAIVETVLPTEEGEIGASSDSSSFLPMMNLTSPDEGNIEII